MNHKQLVQQMSEMKAQLEAYQAELDSLRGQVTSYENIETPIPTNNTTSRRKLLKRMAIAGIGGIGALGLAASVGTNNTVLAYQAADNAIEATGGSDGYGLKASGGLAPLFLGLATAGGAGAPSAGGHNAGEVFADQQGSLYFLTSTSGANRWRKLASANSYGDANGHIQPGSYFLLPASDRFVDTRGNSGNPLGISIGTKSSGGGAGAGYATLNITGTPGRSGNQIPAGATAVTGNLTVVLRSNSYNGAIKILPGNTSDLSKGTAVIAYNGSTNGAAYSNSFSSPLASDGTLKIALYSFSGSDYNADVIIDVVGYYL